MSNYDGALTIEAKVLAPTTQKPKRVKAKVVAGTAELTLPYPYTTTLPGALRDAAQKLATVLNRGDVVPVAPTNDGWLYRAYPLETADARFEVKVSRA